MNTLSAMQKTTDRGKTDQDERTDTQTRVTHWESYENQKEKAHQKGTTAFAFV